MNSWKGRFVWWAIGVAVIGGCEEKKEAVQNPAAIAPVAATVLPADLLLTAEPAGAVEVSAAKKNLKEGDAVVLKGIVGGEEKPFASDRAAFTLLDPAAKTCDKMPGHTCATPWDACCDPELPDHILKIRLVRSDGGAIPGNLDGVARLKPMRQVVVVGTVHKNDDAPGLAIDATHLFVKGPEPSIQ